VAGEADPVGQVGQRQAGQRPPVGDELVQRLAQPQLEQVSVQRQPGLGAEDPGQVVRGVVHVAGRVEQPHRLVQVRGQVLPDRLHRVPPAARDGAARDGGRRGTGGAAAGVGGLAQRGQHRLVGQQWVQVRAGDQPQHGVRARRARPVGEPERRADLVGQLRAAADEHAGVAARVDQVAVVHVVGVVEDGLVGGDQHPAVAGLPDAHRAAREGQQRPGADPVLRAPGGLAGRATEPAQPVPAAVDHHRAVRAPHAGQSRPRRRPGCGRDRTAANP
jgi:hypothetical protein